MPKIKTPTKKSKIKIHKIGDEPLLDQKLIRKEKKVLFRILITALILAVLIALGAYAYFYLAPIPQETNETADILVPKQNLPSENTETQQIDVPEPPTPVELFEVEILATPVGILNVRNGPGTNFEKIGEVKPGESYVLISEDQDAGWYEIRLSSSSTGWVIKKYAKMKE